MCIGALAARVGGRGAAFNILWSLDYCALLKHLGGTERDSVTLQLQSTSVAFALFGRFNGKVNFGGWGWG